MFGKLERSDLELMRAYIKGYKDEAIYLLKPFQDFEKDQCQGEFLGHVEKGQLLGLFFFSNKKSLMVHISNQTVLNHMGLLKAIRHYQPKFIKGNHQSVAAIYQMICRIVKTLTEDQLYLMTYESLENCEVQPLASSELTCVSGKQAKPFDDLRFFIKVEQAFGRNIQTVSDVQKDWNQRRLTDDYCLIKREDKIIAQGIVEEASDQVGVIGGIYVDPQYRQKGIGLYISSFLTNHLIHQGKSPVLFVLKKNTSAINLYQKIGYKVRANYAILTVSF